MRVPRIEFNRRSHRFETVIREPTVNRPGLVLSTRGILLKRMQVIGNAEAYSSSPSPPPNASSVTNFLLASSLCGFSR
jgi:hypothetical protein